MGEKQVKSAFWLYSGPTLLPLQPPKTKRWVTGQMPLEYSRTEETTEGLPKGQMETNDKTICTHLLEKSHFCKLRVCLFLLGFDVRQQHFQILLSNFLLKLAFFLLTIFLNCVKFLVNIRRNMQRETRYQQLLGSILPYCQI